MDLVIGSMNVDKAIIKAKKHLHDRINGIITGEGLEVFVDRLTGDISGFINGRLIENITLIPLRQKRHVRRFEDGTPLHPFNFKIQIKEFTQ